MAAHCLRVPWLVRPSLARSLGRVGGASAALGHAPRHPRPTALLPVPARLWNHVHVSCISTSEKSKVVAAADKTAGHGGAEVASRATESLEEKDENWISFGYELTDRDEDEWAHHLMMFCCITIAICWGGFFLAYYPDYKDHSWAQREAYLELERRESSGLPLIDPNMINPDNIELPAEEELGDFDIVI